MSKIAKRIISIPANVKINYERGAIFAEGPLGKSESLIIRPEVEIIIQENKVFTRPVSLPLAGTYNSLISNLIKGVTKGYQETLELKGTGYKVIQKNNRLEFELGKSRKKDGSLQDSIDIPPNLKVSVKGSKILIQGTSKQKVRKFAINDIRSLQKPNVYKKDKGIYFLGEEWKVKAKKVRK